MNQQLNCLHRMEEILSDTDAPLADICGRLLQVLPEGWRRPEDYGMRIVVEGERFDSPDFDDTHWSKTEDILTEGKVCGTISVSFRDQLPDTAESPFTPEETRLLRTVSMRLGRYLTHKRTRGIRHELEQASKGLTDRTRGEWRAVLEMTRQTNRRFYLGLARKMLNHLSWSGVPEAEQLLQKLGMCAHESEAEELLKDWNVPGELKHQAELSEDLSEVAFAIAAAHLDDEEILALIKHWIQEGQLSFLARVVNRHLSLAEVADALQRYEFLSPDESAIEPANKRGITVALIRRFLGDQLEYINVAQRFFEPRDFYLLLKRIIFSAESHGKLGGKGAGLHLAAQILRREAKQNELLANVRLPKTWHITSDVVLNFMHHNGFEEVLEQKYKDIKQIRLEYPHIVQDFKSGFFPQEIVAGLAAALDDLGDQPIIVRSSSLLEDRLGSAFSGKYKSLFLANQGSKGMRLEALMAAVAEVFASTFSPDPIEYRVERGLIDYGEEMGVMIQEVVGTRVGRYFLPSYAGVAFSNNEFRWSPRIRREDGLLRLVPGMGTRAVDRLGDDYPVLVAPGQPGLRANVSIDEVLRYSPRKIDLIDLKTNQFVTVDLPQFIREHGNDLPGLNRLISIYRDGHLEKPFGMEDLSESDAVVTFEGLTSSTPFVKRMKAILDTLKRALGHPVDIEFASDGVDLYLLQCRPQSYAKECRPAPIPRKISPERVLFTARRHVSNGAVPGITHVVYVDPHSYAELESQEELLAVGRAVSRLNHTLPRRQFILIGPGRWGSRGDIKLGVNVTYSDINNTAALIEVAFKKGNYVPDLSFGTHFFQDLVEANIHYLPLYPDDDQVRFNEDFFTGSANALADIAPEFAALADTVRVIDVSAVTEGRTLELLMNGDLDEAVAIFSRPGFDLSEPAEDEKAGEDEAPFVNRLARWQEEMADRIAAETDPVRFGIDALYHRDDPTGENEQIQLLVQFKEAGAQRDALRIWLEGWDHGLREQFLSLTGHRPQQVLDIRFFTGEEARGEPGRTAGIGSEENPARPLALTGRRG